MDSTKLSADDGFCSDIRKVGTVFEPCSLLAMVRLNRSGILYCLNHGQPTLCSVMRDKDRGAGKCKRLFTRQVYCLERI